MSSSDEESGARDTGAHNENLSKKWRNGSSPILDGNVAPLRTNESAKNVALRSKT